FAFPARVGGIRAPRPDAPFGFVEALALRVDRLAALDAVSPALSVLGGLSGVDLRVGSCVAVGLARFVRIAFGVGFAFGIEVDVCVGMRGGVGVDVGVRVDVGMRVNFGM